MASIARCSLRAADDSPTDMDRLPAPPCMLQCVAVCCSVV